MSLMNDIIYNLIIMLLAYGYIFIVIGVGIFLQKKMNKSTEFTRKTIHVFAGFVTFSVFFFTPSFAWLAIIIAGTFIVMVWMVGPNGPEFAKSIFSAMAREEDMEEGKIYGPLYYAITTTILTAIFTLIPQLVSYYWIPVVALSQMYLGDGIAPFIGKKYGKRTYGPNNRTFEGSIAVFLFGFLGAVITMVFAAFFPAQQIVLNLWVVAIALISAAVFAVIESCTPKGFDNITCSFASTAIIALFVFVII